LFVVSVGVGIVFDFAVGIAVVVGSTLVIARSTLIGCNNDDAASNPNPNPNKR